MHALTSGRFSRRKECAMDLVKFLCVVSCACFLISGPRYTNYVSDVSRKIIARKSILKLTRLIRFFPWCFLAICLAATLTPGAVMLVPIWLLVCNLFMLRRKRNGIPFIAPPILLREASCIGVFLMLIQAANYKSVIF